MTRLLAILGAILAALVCAGAGGFILYTQHTTPGALIGAGLVLLAVAIALPVQLRAGTHELKDNAILIVPVIKDAVAGGDRHTDPKL